MIGQIKDGQVDLTAFPDKRLKLTILVADIPTSYGILLRRTFCRDLGGEIKLDWSQAVVPIGDKKVTLQPHTKCKYIVFPSDDPKSHILYQETDFSNYLIMPEIEVMKENDEEELWTLEFDGSCSSTSLGDGVVLISPTE